MNFKDISPTNPNFRKAIIDFTLSMPVAKFFGIKFVSVEYGEVVLEMPYRDELSASKGMLQGGPVGTLVDIAACAAIGTTLPEGWGFSTTDFNTKFVAAASGLRFIAKGKQFRRVKHSLSVKLNFMPLTVTQKNYVQLASLLLVTFN